jgi:hypothetical protein
MTVGINPKWKVVFPIVRSVFKCCLSLGFILDQFSTGVLQINIKISNVTYEQQNTLFW